jgi:hypothetical protein
LLYKQSKIEELEKKAKNIKILKDMNISDENIIKLHIDVIKITNMLVKLHSDDYKEETLIILWCVQFSLVTDDKTDNQYTELLEKIYFESAFDNSFLNEIENYLNNLKIYSFFEKLLNYFK